MKRGGKKKFSYLSGYIALVISFVVSYSPKFSNYNILTSSLKDKNGISALWR